MKMENKNNNVLINHPKNKYSHFICSKSHPMPIELKDVNKWEHEDVSETDYDGDYYIEYKCKNCNHIFREEMPE